MKPEDLYNFEAEIAYFYDVPNPQPVRTSYLCALKKLEEIGPHSDRDLLQRELMPHLEAAYQSVALQRQWSFDVRHAAALEFKLFLEDFDGTPLESAIEILAELYRHVFHSNSLNIFKAAMLRTFLYRYKAEIWKKEQTISQADQEFMKKIAQESKNLLKPEGLLI
jgi:hypothetical protein